MKLINFHGLNCYYNSIVTVAAFLGVDYPASFATLWSETDFTYDPICHIYLTQRMFTALEALGARLEILNCSPKEKTNESLALFQPGEWIIVGMDAFYIPQNQYYQTLHGFHYFLVHNTHADLLYYFDPTYNQKQVKILREDIIAYAFDICRIRKVAAKPLHIGPVEEARKVMRAHPETKEKLLEQISGCTCGNQKNAGLLAAYVDALISNRYLYRHYLESLPSAPSWRQHCFTDDFLLRWTAVKNGLYKASLIKNNESLIDELCKQFNDLFDAEIDMAEKTAAMSCR